MVIKLVACNLQIVYCTVTQLIIEMCLMALKLMSLKKKKRRNVNKMNLVYLLIDHVITLKFLKNYV